MPGPPRADEAGGLYHALNRCNRVNESITKEELDAFRLSAKRVKPFGNEAWVESMARQLNLESTIRPQGRPQVRFPTDETNKEA